MTKKSLIAINPETARKTVLEYLKANNNNITDAARIFGINSPVTFAGRDIRDFNDPNSIQIWNEGRDNVPQSLLQADKLTAFSKYTACLTKKGN